MTVEDTREPRLDEGSIASGGRGVALALGGLVVGFALAFVLFGRPAADSSGATSSDAPTTAAEADELWTCPMHPEILSETPGACPICGMDLVPATELDDAASPAEHAGHDHAAHDHAAHDHAAHEDGVHATLAATELWTCPMHPEILDEEPGDCPICGMDLVTVETDTAETDTAETPLAAGSGGRSTVTLDPGRIQAMNVTTAPATLEALGRPIDTVGYLDYDQERMVTVTTKYSGWVEEVHVNNLGERVRRGQPLFSVYSPELVQTKQELLSALDYADDLRDAPDGANRRAESLVESARTRLSYWDVSKAEVDRLVETGEVVRTLTVPAPASGVVMKRQPGLEGMAIRPGMEIFHIADLSTLWLTVEVYEGQIAWVREGTPATVELSYFPGETFRGVVRYLEPALSEATRTLRVQIQVPNVDGKLRKGMFASVRLEPPTAAADTVVTVPSEAVLRTGRREVVVVAEGGGRFTPREVTIGRSVEGRTAILEGLSAGDEVVTSAQFLLDSESRLRDAVRQLVAERRSVAEGAR